MPPIPGVKKPNSPPKYPDVNHGFSITISNIVDATYNPELLYDTFWFGFEES